MFSIHPSQVAIINEAFRPSAADVARAKRIVAAYEAAAARGDGSTSLDGEMMIDAPVYAQAKRLLDSI